MTGLDYKIQEMAQRIRELREVTHFTAEEMANVFAVVADAANIMLTAGAPTPADTTETVTHTRMTPVPIATFLSIVSVALSSIV